MKTKLISLLLCLVVLLLPFSLSACDDEDESDDYSPSKSGTIVYVTRTGSKYHRGSCNYLSSSKIEIDLDDAKDDGYSPCSKCNPPK